MSEIVDILISASFWAAVLRIASPLIFATMGELICERAGVLNLGIEGIMAAGCMSGWTWVYLGGDLWTGILFAAFIGGRWYTFDATQAELKGGYVAVGYGRDAADVAVFNQFGPAVYPTAQTVRVERIRG